MGRIGERVGAGYHLVHEILVGDADDALGHPVETQEVDDRAVHTLVEIA